jgi:hypothetical protein
MVVLGLALVPAVPVANVALAQNYDWGFEFIPGTIVVGPSSSFNAIAWVTQYGDQPTDAWSLWCTFNASMLQVSGVASPALLCDGGAPSFPPGEPGWNNTAGNVHNAYGEGPPINNCTTTSFWYSNITFNTLAITGTTTVNFRWINPAQATEVQAGPGIDILNWSRVVNLTVIISAGATCCANMTGNGNVTVDATEFAPPGGCVQDGALNHTFDLLATPDGGWQFVNWSGNVDGAITANPNTITINNGGTATVMANFSELENNTCIPEDLLDFGNLFVGTANPADETFDVTNCGGGQLNWTSTLTWLAQPSANVTINWTPQAGGPLGNGSSETVNVSVNISGATAADVGTYTANITASGSGSDNVTVTFELLGATTIIPCRNITLPHVTFVYPGESYLVNVSWVTPAAGNVSSVSLIDNSSVANVSGTYLWDTVVQISESPAAASKIVRGTGNTSVEYQWALNYAPGTNMSVLYSVTVPANAEPGWYNMTVCPDDSTGWIEYYIGETAYTNCIDCDFQIFVAAPAYLEGTVWEVVWNWFRLGYDGSSGNLLLSGVNVTAEDGILVWNITDAVGYYNVTVVPGANYNVTATHIAGDFAAKTQVVNIPVVGGVVVCDFIGVDGLEPNAPFYTPKFALSYATKAVNAWLITPSVPAAALTLTEVGNVTAMWLNTP